MAYRDADFDENGRKRGFSRRDQIAASALQGFVSQVRPDITNSQTEVILDDAVALSVALADKLIAELDKE